MRKALSGEWLLTRFISFKAIFLYFEGKIYLVKYFVEKKIKRDLSEKRQEDKKRRGEKALKYIKDQL
jgi:hypothetical protein